jgi:proteasome lid subunit RPN8/RPN11
MIHDIERHFKDEYPREGCGIISVVKGKKKWFPCTNIAEYGEDFIIDSQEYLKLKRTTDIVAIVHSHPDSSSEPSQPDIKYCNALGIPYYIYSYPDMELTILDPVRNTTELYGREYEFGVRDCFEATRDFLESRDILIPSRAMFEDDWWERGLDYFTEDTMAEWSHVAIPLTELQENDVLIFNVKSEIGNHCGVYIGNECFYHHAEKRLSCRESIYPFWHKYLKGAYRYDA